MSERIRITLERRAHTGWDGRLVSARTIVREFDDMYRASNWFIHDSYFDEPYTVTALWERL